MQLLGQQLFNVLVAVVLGDLEWSGVGVVQQAPVCSSLWIWNNLHKCKFILFTAFPFNAPISNIP